MPAIDIRLPNIGDFHDVPVVEVHVDVGSDVGVEDILITLESEKATLDVPSPYVGKIIEILVKPGDRVSEGDFIVRLEVAGAAAETDATRARPPVSAALPSASAPAIASRGDLLNFDLAVMGAGPGGYSAAFRAADLGLKTVLIERFPTLGGVCLNVGCIPSKTLLRVASVIAEAATLSRHGVQFSKPEIDLDGLRKHKDTVVGKLTDGLATMAKARGVKILQGTAAFRDQYKLDVDLSTENIAISFKHAIVAAGSEAVNLPGMPCDPRIINSTGALKLRSVPKNMLVIGGGIIGLEMATVYSTLGTRIDVVEILDGLMSGADHDLVRIWQKFNASRFDHIMLKTKATAVEAREDGIHIRFDGVGAPKETLVYDIVLVAVGRTPNGKRVGVDRAGVHVDARGFIPVDRQMRTNVSHIFAIGDIASAPMLAHKAVHEGHVAAEAIAGKKSFFDARQIPSVAYTDPEIAWVGKTEKELRSVDAKFEKAVFPWAASGRALANAREEGFTKLLFDKETHRLIGGGIIGTHAGDLIGEVCLAIELGADAVDIARTIHPHPTLSETIGLAAEVYEGVCTDLMPSRSSGKSA